jgi:SAM-dependent methyltransferase
MKDKSYQRKTCRICESRKLTLVVPISATPPGDHYLPADRISEQQVYPLDIYLCEDCGLAQLPFVVDPGIVYSEYLYTTSISLGLREHFRQSAAHAIELIGPTANTFAIDIGSNDGTLLSFFKSAGFRVLGVDPAREIAAKATAGGIETVVGFLTPALAQEIRAQYGTATLVTANNVMANVDDLNQFMAAVRHLLAPEGLFILETGYGADLVLQTLFDVVHHEHISYFSVGPLQALCRQHNMQIISSERIATKGGSLRVAIQLGGGRRLVGTSVERMMRWERSVGANAIPFYKSFSAKIDSIRERLLVCLYGIQSKGQKVIGYGASVGTTTQIYHFGIRHFLDSLVDDNPQRHGLVSPGYHIPVLSPAFIRESNPDYLLVFAWRYLDAIRIKHNQFQGRYIIPLPDLKIV